MAKLTRHDVSAIKRALIDYPKIKISKVAEYYKVSYDTIWDIKAGRYWKNVQPMDEFACPHCAHLLEDIKAHCRIVDRYIFIEGTNQIDCVDGGEDPHTYEYWCGYCGGDLTPYISLSTFNTKGGDE